LVRKTVFLLLMGAAAVAAQRASGYAAFTAGAASGQSSGTPRRLGAALGAEIALGKGLALNPELSCQSRSACGSGSILGLASVGGSYHFVTDRERKNDPFLTGGYALSLGDAAFSELAGLYYFGAGLTHWFRARLGLRLEFRDDVYPGRLRTIQYWGLRAGIAFR
jgi:hypothetical protein